MKKLERLTPNKMNCISPFVESDTNVLFAGINENEKVYNIYSINLKDKKLAIRYNNATCPTTKR